MYGIIKSLLDATKSSNIYLLLSLESLESSLSLEESLLELLELLEEESRRFRFRFDFSSFDVEAFVDDFGTSAAFGGNLLQYNKHLVYHKNLYELF